MGKNVITVNGVRIECEGNNVSVVNGVVTVDGKQVANIQTGTTIKWEGPLATLTSDESVSCGDVKGDVRAGGSVSCDKVDGSVNAGGSVSCGRVGGSVCAGGSVCHG